MRRVATSFLLVFVLAGCGATKSNSEDIEFTDDTGTSGDDTSTGDDGSTGDDSATEFDLGSGNDTSGGDDTGDDTGGLADTVVVPTDTNCATSEVVAAKPRVDIIFTIDQSESMNVEIVQVKNNINKLATFLGATGLDYRVVMIAAFNPSSGNAYKVCVPPPLGGATCTSNSASLRLVDQYIYSTDSLKYILSTYDQMPPSNKAWQDFLRKDALKIFVPVTDDNSSGTMPTAAQFDSQILAKPGGQFGTAAQRNYKFYPIAGANKFPSETKCTSAVNASATYIALAKLTGGKWWPVCDLDYGPIFTEMGKDIAATVACEVTVPPPPAGETFDPNKVNVVYTPSSGGSVTIAKDDANPCAAGANGWQVSADGTKILLCGTACSGLKADPGGKVSVQFGCAGAPPPPPPDAGMCTPFGAVCGDADICCAPLACLPGADNTTICRAKGPA